MLSVPQKALVYVCTGVLLCGCLVTQENQDAWEVAVVEDMEDFYQEVPPEGVESAADSTAEALPPGEERLVTAGGGYHPPPVGQQLMLSCASAGGRPGETTFQCRLNLHGLAEEAELPAVADLFVKMADESRPGRIFTAPLAYVAEEETYVQFVLVLENTQIEGGVSLKVTVNDERGTHSAGVSLSQTSVQATIGLTADQLGGVR